MQKFLELVADEEKRRKSHSEKKSSADANTPAGERTTKNKTKTNACAHVRSAIFLQPSHSSTKNGQKLNERERDGRKESAKELAVIGFRALPLEALVCREISSCSDNVIKEVWLWVIKNLNVPLLHSKMCPGPKA
ncbi:hypothetical protein KGM_208605 [Danaus plexippus plexippus]|uniref:Uncharacterized protein n=1 Tax=Danaus plexippus plexippus TaxID=278856 RepID=A0A212EUE0_DANPL|nr:hypothetical protein KGM_208605 [Danaus plexippus plexippus]